MIKASCTLVGERALAAQLRSLPPSVGGENLERAVTSGALLIINRAKELVPRKTANLARSLHVGGHTYGEDGANTGSDIHGNRHDATHAEVLAGTNVDYAGFVEDGTSHQAAQPYLRPAFDEEKEHAFREIKESLWDQLRRQLA